MITGNLQQDLDKIKKAFHNSFDLVVKEFVVGESKKCCLIFLECFSDSELINLSVLKPLLTNKESLEAKTNKNLGAFIKDKILLNAKVNEVFNLNDVSNEILYGNTIILVDAVPYALVVNLKKQAERNISEPVIEPNIRGPHDGFTESLNVNISLIRRRIRTHELKMEEIKLGRLSQTSIVITYVNNIVNEDVLNEIRKKLLKIDIDAILESGYIEELIESNNFSPFSQFGYTERPDRLASNLLEGCVGILIDTTPIALIAPQTFFQLMQSSEDFYERAIPASFIRLIRYFFLCIALTLPSFYISVVMFHHGMLPLPLLRTFAMAREGVPFPIIIETLILEIFFEGLREAGIRLPRVIGQTVSIVGALIIGEAAVRAGLVSSSTVIIVSITGIASFLIPRYNLSLSIRILRFFMMILASIFGFFGMFIGLLALLIHMVNLESFGVPYLSPIAPLDLNSIKGIFIRPPWSKIITRPTFISKKNIKRNKKIER